MAAGWRGGGGDEGEGRPPRSPLLAEIAATKALLQGVGLGMGAPGRGAGPLAAGMIPMLRAATASSAAVGTGLQGAAAAAAVPAPSALTDATNPLPPLPATADIPDPAVGPAPSVAGRGGGEFEPPRLSAAATALLASLPLLSGRPELELAAALYQRVTALEGVVARLASRVEKLEGAPAGGDPS